MTKKELKRQLKNEFGRNLDIDINGLCGHELITTMRDVDGFMITPIVGGRHQITFAYKSDTSNQGIQTIFEDYLY